MTPREELMQAIQASPDDVIDSLLNTLKKLTAGSSSQKNLSPDRPSFERLHRKEGVLVAETEWIEGFDTTEFVKEMREERMQDLDKRSGL